MTVTSAALGAPAVAVVPTAPLLLPAVSPRQPAELVAPVAALRDAVAGTLAGLPGAVAVLVVAGERTEVHRATSVDRTPSGHPQATAAVLLADDAALRTVAAALDAEVDDTEVDDAAVLDGDLGVLAALHAAACPERPAVGVTVAAPALDADAVVALRTALTDLDACLVVAGDLAATREVTSPGYVVDGAVAVDDAVAAALRAGDLAALREIGAAEAERVQARGWVPLTWAAAVAGGPFPEVVLVAPRGVGQLVAVSVPTGAPRADAVQPTAGADGDADGGADDDAGPTSATAG